MNLTCMRRRAPQVHAPSPLSARMRTIPAPSARWASADKGPFMGPLGLIQGTHIKPGDLSAQPKRAYPTPVGFHHNA
jgi:hypothetical protein